MLLDIILLIDTDSQSYVICSPSEILYAMEKEKKAKYLNACGERRALSTFLCFSVDGMMGGETEAHASSKTERF